MNTEHAAPDDGTRDISSPVTLTIKNTQKVYERMYDAREKWRSIGGIFGISESTLDNIDSENRSNEDKLRKVIIEWLKGNGDNKNLTWSQVVIALRNETVAREDLAQKVLQLHPQPGLECATVQSGSASSLPDNAQTTAVARKPTTSLSPRGKCIVFSEFCSVSTAHWLTYVCSVVCICYNSLCIIGRFLHTNCQLVCECTYSTLFSVPRCKTSL